LSLDDFGTGHSSLAHLQRFPFDAVKIDRAFIRDVNSNAGNAAIATAVIAMAHSLHLRVVAEGVETEGQLQFLRRRRCDELQGFYFSEAVPAAQFEAMLVEQTLLTLGRQDDEDTLLIVDDEPDNLSTLRRLLRREGYRVLTASGGQEGLNLLALHKVQVIICGQRMPNMSGTRFMRIVRELYPDTIRIILSGFTDLAAVTDSVNQGELFKFMTKPWDDGELVRNIRDGFRLHRQRNG
jgi:CheY-like chemotaxis protein